MGPSGSLSSWANSRYPNHSEVREVGIPAHRVAAIYAQLHTLGIDELLAGKQAIEAWCGALPPQETLKRQSNDNRTDDDYDLNQWDALQARAR
jgi:hypothetical protein